MPGCQALCTHLFGKLAGGGTRGVGASVNKHDIRLPGLGPQVKLGGRGLQGIAGREGHTEQAGRGKSGLPEGANASAPGLVPPGKKSAGQSAGAGACLHAHKPRQAQVGLQVLLQPHQAPALVIPPTAKSWQA